MNHVKRWLRGVSLACSIALPACTLVSGEDNLHAVQDATAPGSGAGGDAGFDASTEASHANPGDASEDATAAGNDATAAGNDATAASNDATAAGNDASSLDGASDTSDAGGADGEAGTNEGDGAVAPTCAVGLLDCGDAGCLPDDPHNCGRCGHDCTELSNVSGTVMCVQGVCTYGASSCAPGFGICSTNPDDGCAAINTPAQCGACSTACGSATPVCSSTNGAGTAFACATGCPAGDSLCGGSCVNEQSDPLNCGSCANACPTDPAGTATCTGGAACGLQCNPGRHVCAGACVSNTDTNNCGTSCGTNCPGPTRGTGNATCNGSACALTCASGETACSGACVDLQSDSANCSACGNPCASGSTCLSGICCSAGMTNCGGTCVNTQTDNGNCGTCTTACSNSRTCQGGQCLCLACAAACTNFQTDPLNCGTCGHNCGPGTCSAGVCQSWPVITATVNGFASDGAHIIWVDATHHEILQANIDGTNVLTLSANTNFNPGSSSSFALSGSTVVLVSNSQQAFKATVGAASSGSTLLPITLPTGSSFSSVAVNAGATRFGVMVGSSTGGSHYEAYDCPMAGPTCTDLGSAGSNFPQGAAANASTYFLSDVTEIFSFAFGGSASVLQPSQEVQGGVAIDGSNVYWIGTGTWQGGTGSGPLILRSALSGGTVSNVATAFTSSFYPSGPMATDGKYVYAQSSQGDAAIYYAPVTGCCAMTSLTAAAILESEPIVAAGGYVFWASGSTIFGIAAPP